MGIKALHYWMDRYPEELKRIPKKFIVEGSIIVLENNTFEFGEQNYRQVLGTAMGTKFAPTNATLSLGYLEEVMYSKIRKDFSLGVSQIFKGGFLDISMMSF